MHESSLHPDTLFLLGQATGKKTKKHSLNMNHIYLFPKKPPDTEHPYNCRAQKRTRHHKAMVWLSVAVHTVSGAHFHMICMIRLIGLVWKHFRGKVVDFLQLHQLEIKSKNGGTSEAWTSLQACAFEGHMNQILSNWFWFHHQPRLIGINLTVMLRQRIINIV